MTQTLNEKKKDVVNILWTGGWDSTFRMIQLSTKDIIIQPFYLKDNRKSENLELDAIQSITEGIRNLASTKCIIREVRKMNVSDINEDTDITAAYKKLFEKQFFGSQYDWLARFAKNIYNLELSIHQDDKAFSVIKEFGSVKKNVDDQKGEYFVIDPLVSSKDIIKVFGNYHFPLLYYSKLEMKKEAEEKGFMDLMNKTWFCYTPVNNQPCGKCNPCMYTIEEGIEYRFNKVALRKYRRRKFIISTKKTPVYRGLRKIWRFIKPINNNG